MVRLNLDAVMNRFDLHLCCGGQQFGEQTFMLRIEMLDQNKCQASVCRDADLAIARKPPDRRPKRRYRQSETDCREVGCNQSRSPDRGSGERG